MTARELLAEARRRLAEAPFAPSGREALLLLSRVLGWSEAQLLARTEASMAPEKEARFRSLLERRLAGEPVAYLLGEKEFYGRLFTVDRRVLIPRPETEHLVEAVLAQPLPLHPRILDLGTGSGCLAVTLALELPAARLSAVDSSVGALAVAGANCRRHGVAPRVCLAAGLWGDALTTGAFDLLVCNPPYIDAATAGELSLEILDHEPPEALFADHGGMASYEELLAGLGSARPGTPLLLEIGAGQLTRLEELATRLGWEVEGAVMDYGGWPRVLRLRAGR